MLFRSSGAVDGLTRHGVKDENVDVYWVPGAFEMPLVAKKLSNSGKYDAVICLGTVIRGSTTHYELVSAEVAKGIAQVSLANKAFRNRNSPITVAGPLRIFT